MIVKITAKRQVTFPARVLDAMGVGPGDSLELEEGPDGFILRPRRIDRTVGHSEGVTRTSTFRYQGSSGSKDMTQRYGIDTSVLVRL